MESGAQVGEIIRKRYSCRNYREEGLPQESAEKLERYVRESGPAPLGSEIRFSLAAANGGDSAALKGLGTYGVIKNPAAFIIGALKESRFALEDYGYLMEKNILFATSLGLGSCWLGGSYTRSSFAERIGCGADERVPAVASVGLVSDRKTVVDSFFRATAGSRKRKPWEEIFFQGNFQTPLGPEGAQAYRDALEMLRIAPSASNKQPWRIVKEAKSDTYHFFLCRSKAYGMSMRLIGMDDLQRVDMGIAMSHFELAARAAGRTGEWEAVKDGIPAGGGCEYVTSWTGA
ncbi:MAG: nitroreductase [Spirochaetes bacterium]|nr:MAG: nitroreductase [Spirochaetota bacterium]